MRDNARSITELYQSLRPLILRDVSPLSSASSSGGMMEAHALNGPYHTGTLIEAQAPWAATKNDIQTLIDNGLLHDRVHLLADTTGLGSDHTVAGLTAGQYLRATGATTAAFASILDADLPSTIVRTSRTLEAGDGLTGLGNLSADRSVSIELSATSGLELFGTSPNKTLQIADTVAGAGLSITSKVLAVGAANTLLSSAGATGLTVEADTLRLTTSNNPGAAASVLSSSAAGALTLPSFVATTSVNTPSLVSPALTELSIVSGADTVLNPGGMVRLGTGKLIKSYSTFTSGFAGSGWQIDDGVLTPGKMSATFDNLTVRGTMSVYELLIQQIRATNGSVFISSAAKLISATLVSGSSYICVIDGEANDYQPFAVGDAIRAQRVNLQAAVVAAGDGNIVWRSDLVVTAINTGGDQKAFTATLQPGTTVPAAGMEFVRLGGSDVSRRSSIYLTADDSGAPFIDVVSGVTSHADWNTVGMVKVRMGRLDGVTGNTNEYGIWAGDGTLTTSSSIVASTAGVTLNNVPIDFKAGTSTVVMRLAPGSSAPFMALGSTLPTGPLVNDGIWLGKDGAAYKFRVGTVSGGALVKGFYWDGADLTWKATNTSLDSSGNLVAGPVTLSAGGVSSEVGAYSNNSAYDFTYG